MKKTTRETAAKTAGKVAPKTAGKAAKKAVGTVKGTSKNSSNSSGKQPSAVTAPGLKRVKSAEATKKVKPAENKPKKAVKPSKPAAKPTVKPVKPVTVKPAKTAKPVDTAKPPRLASKPATAAEKGLTAAEIEHYRAKLLMIRARLQGDVTTMTDAALNKNRMEASGDLSVMPIHMADVGSDNFEQEQTLSFMQSESGILDMVEEALMRIRLGTYGICESCGNSIPKVRLNFLPYASMCVKCAAIAQQEGI